jgi:glycosyltransferase involved in cell wall biosynthesis
MYEQLRELRDQHGFEVAAVISGPQGPLVDKLQSSNIPFHVANFEAGGDSPKAIVQLPLCIWRLAQLLRRERFDVVQTHVFRSMVLGRPAAWLADVPMRFAMVAGPFHLEAYFTRWIERLTYWMDSKVIPACERSRELCQELGIPDIRLAQTIYYCPDEKNFDVNKISPASIRDEYGWPADTPLICHVAYFYPRMSAGKWIPKAVHGRGIKGHGDLVRAAAIVTREFPDAKFMLIGHGFTPLGEKYFKEIKELVHELNLESSVVFTGFRTDPNLILRGANVAVQPSLSENCGGSIEALLMETPLVVTRVGGLVDTVRDQETGVIVRPSDPEDLARGILELLRDPQRAKGLGRAGRKEMLERFTLRHTVEDLANLYHSMAAQITPKRTYFNPSVSAFRILVGATVFGYLALRIFILEIYLPIYFAICVARLRSIPRRAYRLGLRTLYTVLGFARPLFKRVTGRFPNSRNSASARREV